MSLLGETMKVVLRMPDFSRMPETPSVYGWGMCDINIDVACYAHAILTLQGPQ